MSDKNMDDLLAQLEEEFAPKRQSRANVPQPPARKSPSKSSSSKSQESMEEMLDELRTELDLGRGRPNTTPAPLVNPTPAKQAAAGNSTKYRDRLNALIDTDYRRKAHKREEKRAALKRQEEARIAERQRREQELIAAQKRAELRERRRKEALKEKAQQWLKNLNLHSEEGKWFEEFSYSYEDKLQAAIDYLEAMRESGL